MKIVTKILANRLHGAIKRLLHQNQYGFIQSRTILHTWLFILDLWNLHLCHQPKKEIIILKLDFEKVFDKMEHQTMLQIMELKGFVTFECTPISSDQRNRTYSLKRMRDIFTSGTSFVLQNGVPGKIFNCRRGVRQGDPLYSPFVTTCCLAPVSG
jgi:hypothetical protein